MGRDTVKRERAAWRAIILDVKTTDVGKNAKQRARVTSHGFYMSCGGEQYLPFLQKKISFHPSATPAPWPGVHLPMSYFHSLFFALIFFSKNNNRERKHTKALHRCLHSLRLSGLTHPLSPPSLLSCAYTKRLYKLSIYQAYKSSQRACGSE